MTRQMSSFGRKIPTFHSVGVQDTNTSRAHSPAVPSLLPPHSYLYKQNSVDSKSSYVPPDMMLQDVRVYTKICDVCMPNTEPESEHSLIFHSKFAKIQGTKDYVKPGKQDPRDAISKN